MGHPEKLFLFFILSGGFICHYAAEGVNLMTLRQVQVVYRHGARTPLFVYPNDPYRDQRRYWPEGPGQLTEVGKEQQYELGQFLRSRYNGFISLEYKKDEIHVLSSDVDRTLMSAEANLAGLYPRKVLLHKNQGEVTGSQSQQSSTKLDIQLVPIHVVPKSTDKTLKMTASCPRADIAVSEYMSTSGDLTRLYEENKEFIKYVCKNTGIPFADVVSVVAVEDPLYSQHSHGLPLPSWVNSTVMERLQQLGGSVFKMQNGGNLETRRLKGGPLAKEILENMEGVVAGSGKSYKFHMYSAHDNTLAAVMSTMDVFDPKTPGYASAFMVELHQDEDGRYYVNLYYRNSTTEQPYELRVPGCGTPCCLEDLREVLEPVIPENWEQECYTSSVQPSHHNPHLRKTITLVTWP